MATISQPHQCITMKKCNDQCCSYFTKPYTPRTYIDFNEKRRRKKAGVFFYDRKNDRILLVKSCGKKWGPPKGTMEDIDQTIEDCAIREVFEETGIRICKQDLQHPIRIHKTYYFVIYKNDLTIQPMQHDDDNDANGIGLFRPVCLQQLIQHPDFDINAHCRILCHQCLNVELVK